MTLWKTAWNSLKKNAVLNMFAVVQMSAVFALTAIMVSSLSIRYASYKPFEDYLNGKGIFVYYSGFASKSAMSTLFDDILDQKTFVEQFPEAEQVISCYNPITFIGNDESGYLNFRIISMDNELIQRYQPDLQAGHWMGCEPSGDYVEAVISDNPYGWSLGDTVEVHSAIEPNMQPAKIKIIGILKDGAKIPIGNSLIPESIDYNTLYYPYSFEIEQIPLILLSASALEQTAGENIKQGVASMSMIIYADDTAEETIAEDMQRLNQYGTCYYTDFQSCNDNSRIYLQRQLYNLLPIVIVLLVLTAVSTISSSALSARRRLYDYAVFHVVGLQWKYCSIINFLQSIMIAAASICITTTFLMLLPIVKLQTEIKIIWNHYLFLAEICLIVLYLVFSMIMPLFAIARHTPKQILTQ